MKIEISNEIERLVDIHKGRDQRYPTVAGMAFALLTDEQGEYLIEVLNRWIAEDNNK
jgi:hypothetical protein